MWLLAALATWRAAVLATDDLILERPRLWLAGRLGSPSRAEVLFCVRCSSVWLAVPVFIGLHAVSLAGSWPSTVLGYGGAVGFVALVDVAVEAVAPAAKRSRPHG